MRVVVPYAVDRPKSRLSSVLDTSERRAFARAMLRDVLECLSALPHDAEVLATREPDRDLPAPVRVDDRPLSDAVNAVLAARDPPTAVVMADLALATPTALARLFAAPGDVAVAPGRGGGTNAVVVRSPGFRVDYHGASYLDHLKGAREHGLRVSEVDSFRLATDIDEPRDLVEVLVHSGGAARSWLEAAGFAVETVDGAVEAVRDP